MAFTNPVKSTTQQPLPAQGNNPKAPTNVKPFTPEMDKPRELAPRTKFDTESGLVVPKGGWGETDDAKFPQPETPEKKAAAETTKQVNERHEKWKAEQAEKKEAREAAKLERQTQQQMTAKALLQKGDAAGAAKAMGMTLQEFFTYTNNAMLSIPTKTDQKELSPEQKKAQQEAQLRAAERKEIEDLKRWKYDQVAMNYIKDNISPVLADKERFELINASKELPKIEMAVYEYINNHYQKTRKLDAKGQPIEYSGEILKAEDIFETLEQQFEEAAKASLEANKGIKKFSKYFAPEKKEKPVATVEPEQEELSDEQITQLGAEEETSAINPTFKYNPSKMVSRREQKSAKPFWLMTKEEKAEALRTGNA